MRSARRGLVIALCLSFAPPALADEFGPWSHSEKSPVLGKTKQKRRERAPSSALTVSSSSRPVMWAMRFYSRAISPADGARCPMYPTCAGYAVSAVRKHGPLIGGFLMADRFIHEGSANLDWYEMVSPHGHDRWNDPVEQNDFWFSKQ